MGFALELTDRTRHLCALVQGVSELKGGSFDLTGLTTKEKGDN